MFKYEATAPTPEGLLTVLRNELGHLFSGDAPPRVVSEAPVADASPSSAPAAAPSTESPAEAGHAETASAPSPSETSAGEALKRGRGRPRGSKKSKPAAPPAAGPALPVQETQTAAATSPSQAPAAAAVTFEQMKDVLRGITGTEDGTNKAYEILKSCGYEAVKQVKPEHFGVIHAAATAYAKMIAS